MTKRTATTSAPKRPPYVPPRPPATAAGRALQWGVGLAVWGGFVALVLAYIGAL